MLKSGLLVVLALITNVNSQNWIPPSQSKAYAQGQPTVLYTRGEKTFKEAWYAIQDRTQFIFSVKACSDAILALTSAPLAESDYTMEIVLGAEQNTRSMLRYPFQQGALFDTYTEDILHCNEYRTFWIQWLNNYIQVGRGPTVGEQVFMNIQDLPSHPITSIGLASDKGSAAVWRVNENNAETLLLHTPNEHKYESMWKSVVDRQYWVFAIKSGGHAHIVLAEGQGMTSANVVEFVLGGWDNNRTVIRTAIWGNLGPGGDAMAQAQTPNILSRDEYRFFWVAWVNGSMEIGKGPVFAQDRILRWEDPRRLNVRYLAATTGFGETGEWLIRDSRESLNHIYTKPTDPSQPSRWYGAVWLESPRTPFFVFTVKACKQASFLLSDTRSVDVERDIEVVIGDSGNTKTVFRYMEMFPPGNIAEADTPLILSCDTPRTFWFSWRNDTLRLGRAHIYGSEVILEQKIGAGFYINSIALATPDDTGLWLIPDLFGERLLIRTPDVFNHFDQLWRTIETKDYFTFSVQACSDVHVGLAPTPGVASNEMYYDVVISGWNNQRTQIRRALGGNIGNREDESAPVNTTGLLSCDKRRDLWISWKDGIIRIGRGALPGHHVLLEHTISIMPIKAVSVSTGWGYTGNWYIENDNGDYMMYYTNSIINENSLGLSPDISWISFRLRACSDAHIFLRSSGDTGPSETYEFVLGADYNQRSYIKKGGSQVLSVLTPDIVDCNDEIPVWISWEDGRYDLGIDTIKGMHAIMGHQGETVKFNLMSFYSTAVDLSCRWRMFYNTAYWTSFKTPEFHGYHYVWETVEHRSGIAFSVQACSDVHFVLSDVIRQLDQRYDIVIGGLNNTRSSIRIIGQREFAWADTRGIVSCEERRSFWIAWANGAIEVGHGETVGRDRIMDLQILNVYPVRAIGYSTGYGFNGTWTIKLLDELLAPAPPATENPGGGENTEEQSGGLGGGAVAGIVIGILLAILIVVAVVIRRSRGDLPPLSFSSERPQDTRPIAEGNAAPEQEEADNTNEDITEVSIEGVTVSDA